MGTGAACPADPNLPKEPVDPPTCTTLMATKSTPDEAALDTARIQAALNSCGAGKAVKLTSSGANNAFVTARLTINGTYLMVDAGTTLYASRNPSSYGCSAGTGAASNSCGAVIDVTGSGAGIVGGGIIDGQGGEPIVGMTQSWWDVSVALRASNGSASNPALISVSNATNFVMHNIHIYNSPKFHVKLSSAGYMVWGVEVLTPSKPTNSMGAALTPYGARNTDGIDPGGGSGGTSNGYLVCSKISVGDDEVAIKAGKAHVSNLTFAHNHFGTGHGMSIGSETGAGASNITVYDLTIDGSIPTGGAPNGDVNGLRIKSYNGNGGLVDKVSYSDVCIRNLANPILLNPNYTMGTGTGGGIPKFTNISLKNIQVAGGGTVTLDGFDASNMTTVSLDNVIVDGNPTVTAQNAAITIGPGGVSFPPPTGTGVTVTGSQGTPTPIDCSSRWVTFP
ncbi:MAG: glycoside hydrolase family 28 protein [Myxococcota bacterium]|nr:glycoside hydrolase family 28 protein [Myxococcota bacterium]